MTRASRSRYRSLFAMTMRLRQRVFCGGTLAGVLVLWTACTSHAEIDLNHERIPWASEKVKQPQLVSRRRLGSGEARRTVA